MEVRQPKTDVLTTEPRRQHKNYIKLKNPLQISYNVDDL